MDTRDIDDNGGIRQYAAPFFSVALVLHLPHWLSVVGALATGLGADDLLTALLVVSGLIPYALQGALGFGCSATLRGGRLTFGEIVAAAPAGLFRTLPTVILVVVAVFAAPALLGVSSWSSSRFSGWLVLAVVLVMLAAQALLALAVPAAWCERLGPVRAVRRSLALTRGHRGRLGLLILGLWLGAGLTLAITFGVAHPMTGAALLAWAISLIAVIGSLFGLLYAVSTWIIYERIRRIEEGNPLEPPIAAVFE